MEPNLTNSHYRRLVSEYSINERWFTGFTHFLIIAFYIAVIVVGVLANALFCTVIWKTKRHLKTRNAFFVNMAISDIAMCVICLPFTLVKMTQKSWVLGSFACKLIPTLQVIDVIVFSLTTVAIAIDRYHVIVNASQSKHCSKLSLVVLVITWILAGSIASPVAIFSQVDHVQIMDNKSEYKMCMELWPTDASRSAYTIFVLVIQYVTPFVVIAFLHVRIARFLRVRLAHLNSCTASANRHDKQIESYRRNVTLLAAIVVTFAVAWLPLAILNILADFRHEMFYNVHFNTIYVVCHLFAMTTVFTNPILYGWFNSNFRRDVTSFILRDTNSAERKKLSDDFR